jgi:glycosyltransferase involved in cell wall biosynthesis
VDVLYIVVPCYNEEEVLPETARRLREKLGDLAAKGRVSAESRILFVDDGSKDRTWELITELHEGDAAFSGVSLSRNRGHQFALLAGLMEARKRADVSISMDADLQDDIDAADAMLDRYYEGCDIVYGVRASRKRDFFLKRFTAESFYRIIRSMGGEVVFNHADYRLMSRRALDALSEYGEVNLFLRGIVPMLGYRTGIVEYERGRRFAGESKYSLRKMVALAGEGITSLTAAPLRLIQGLGLLITLAALVLLGVFVAGAFFGRELLGWRIVLFAVLFVGGLIITALGVVGGYVGKIYTEAKRRPRYFIEKVLDAPGGETRTDCAERPGQE